RPRQTDANRDERGRADRPARPAAARAPPALPPGGVHRPRLVTGRQLAPGPLARRRHLALRAPERPPRDRVLRHLAPVRLRLRRPGRLPASRRLVLLVLAVGERSRKTAPARGPGMNETPAAWET